MQTHAFVQSQAPEEIIKPGTLILRPKEVCLFDDKDPVKGKKIYCKFKIGFHTGKSSVALCKSNRATWSDEETIIVERNHNEEFGKLKVKEDGMLELGSLGTTKIDLEFIASKGKLSAKYPLKYPLTCDDKTIGEISLDLEYVVNE